MPVQYPPYSERTRTFEERIDGSGPVLVNLRGATKLALLVLLGDTLRRRVAGRFPIFEPNDVWKRVQHCVQRRR
jgi:hypothetical protein